MRLGALLALSVAALSGASCARSGAATLPAPLATVTPTTTAQAVGSATAAPAAAPPPRPRTPLPPGFTSLVEEREALCMGRRVRLLPESATDARRFVRVTGAGGELLHEAHGRVYVDGENRVGLYLAAELCGDLDGDGVPELLMIESFEGKRGFIHHVVSLGEPVKHLLMWANGDLGTPLVPVKLRPGPSFQLEGLVVFRPPFDSDRGEPVFSFATAPVVPVVLSLVNGEYRLTSFSFPEVYRAHRADVRDRCSPSWEDCCADIPAWLDGLVIGDWESDKKKMKNAALRALLDRRAAATRQRLRAELGSERWPVSASSRW